MRYNDENKERKKKIKNLKGIYTALLTPFTKDGKINEKELAKLVRYNLALGADGFYVCGSTAEALMLNAEERMEIMRIVKDNAKDANLIAHVGSLNERDAHKLAAYARNLGASGPNIYMKFEAGMRFAALISFFRR